MNSPTPTREIQEYNEHSPYFADFYQFFSNVIHNVNGHSSGKKSFSDVSNSPKVIMVTSAVEKEGKSTLASLLSITGALSTHNFHLLIDGDLHRPNLHNKFGVGLENGLSEALMNKKSLQDVVQVTPYGSLHLITAGKMVSNPFELLNIDRMKQLFKELGNYYGMIIVDCPPIIPVSDTLKLAQMADGVVLTVKAGKTPREVVKRAIDILKKGRCNLIGIALNDIGEVLPYYYRSKYYKYKYQLSESD